VGEIGIPRREFLYEINMMEARRIIKGFRRRGRTMMEMQRLEAYCSFFAFRKNETGVTPDKWYPLPWEIESKPGISDEEALALQKEIANINKW
jgi:hypothetical protein